MDTNIIYCGDNLEVLSKYIPADSVDLIYIDPPFNSSRNYEVFWGEAQERRSFEDRFGDAMTYLDWMRPRIRELYRALKPTGNFYYHCDWHASHYIKVELDRIFGYDNFLNEIVWCYDTGGRAKRAFPRKHDIILRYGKSRYAVFYYENVALPRHPETMHEVILKDAEGRLYQRNVKGGKEYRYYLEYGVLPNDWWADIQALNPSSKERLGYPTQKPRALLERIIKAGTQEGDMVLDAFCGCGTTLEAAGLLKREWIGIDFSPTACRVMAERLEKSLGLIEGKNFFLRDMPKSAEQLRRMPPFEFQNWAVVALGGIPNRVKVADYGIDGRLYVADVEKTHKGDFFETLDKWYPIQVKQVDKAGRPDVDKFQTAMRRDKRLKGYFIAFGFSTDAIQEIKRAQTVEGLEIVPITVDELLGYEKTALS